MTNRILEMHVSDYLLDPTEPEVWIRVVPEHLTGGTEVRGRLVGPSCPYATTVEVAYPLRPFPRPSEGLPGLSCRVVIPEASLWEPQSPFLYQGPVELWEGGQCCDRLQLSRGLRTVSLGPRGLRLNGRPFTIQAMAREQFTEEEARLLRQAGCNTILAGVSAGPNLWRAAAQFGFFVLGRLDGGEAGLRQARALQGHPSCLGWVFPQEFLTRDPSGTVVNALSGGKGGPWVGVELQASPAGALPPGVGFILCREDLLASLQDVSLPKVVFGVEQVLSLPGVLGLVLESSSRRDG